MPIAAVRRTALVCATATALVAGFLLDAPRASAATYPSWADVEAARGQESAARAKVTEIQGLLSGLQTRASAALAEAERLGTEYQRASRAADDAAARESRLRSEAAEHADTAQESAAQAGRFAAQLARNGGSPTARLLADGGDARDLLYDLGAMSRLGEQATRIESAATTDAAIARSLTAQADRAAVALDDAASVAERRMQEAQSASDRAQSLVAEQQDNEDRLEAQLASLTSGTARTEADYRAGVAAAAAARAAAEAAARRAAEEAAAAGGSGGGGGGVGSGSGSGWVRPGGGGISSVYGWRVNPVSGKWAFHDGVDLASGCSTAIVAAAAGTVDYVGRFGGYGNYVRIIHPDGTKTAYGHIVDGGFRVSRGQAVGAGQLVALVGSTGNSTGCHLHFETHVGGGSTDPVPFLSARSVDLH